MDLPSKFVGALESAAQSVVCRGDLPSDPEIQRAVRKGDTAIVGIFLGACGDPGHTLRPDSITVAQLAARKGQWPVLEALLAQRWPWKRIDGSEHVDGQSNNLLHLAAISCNVDTIQKIFSRWRSLAADRNSDDLRPAELLGKCDDEQSLQQLYREMLEATVEYTALPMLIATGYAQSFDELSDIQRHHVDSIRSAVRKKDVDSIVGLIRLGSPLFGSGAPIGPFDASGTTLAGMTLQEGQNGVLAEILDRFPEQINQPDNLRRTPLMLSVAAENTDAVTLLIKKGASLRDGTGSLDWLKTLTSFTTVASRSVLEQHETLSRELRRMAEAGKSDGIPELVRIGADPNWGKPERVCARAPQ